MTTTETDSATHPLLNPPRSAAVAAGLRQLADMIECHPDLPIDYPRMTLWSLETAEQARSLGFAALRAGAAVSKDYTDNLMRLEMKFGPLVVAGIAWRHEVCERVVVGQQVVTEKVPDPQLLAQVPTVEVSRTEDVVEWRCAPGIGSE